jgi:hypothetical protein
MTIGARRNAVSSARRALEHLRMHYDSMDVGISLDDIAIMHLEGQIKQLRSHYRATQFRPVNWQEHSISHPRPGMNEPEKRIVYLTEQAYEIDPEELAKLMVRGTLGGIDRFFMQVRRKLSLMERPIGTASKMRRTWYGYSPYNPRIIQKMLDIYRVYYDYVKVGQDKMTPAMRLGLARSPLKMEDILYYR